MNIVSNYPAVLLLVAVALISIYHIVKRSMGKNKPKTSKSDAKYLTRTIGETESEMRLYLDVNEQLGDCYLVQFGTSLKTIVSKIEQDVPDVAIDILLLDPRTLKPQLAFFVTAGGRDWYNESESKTLEALDLLSSLNIHTLSMPKQDYYKADIVVKQMLDMLNDTDGETKEFY